MVVYVVDNASPKLRGELSLWCLEVKPGVFVGNPNKLVRDKIWDVIAMESDYKGALMIWSTNTEQGFDISMIGLPDRSLVDFDGLKLIMRKTDT